MPLKKYFYVLRPLLAITWIEKYNEPAPIVFDQLRTLVADDKILDAEISNLLERKRVSLEKEIAPAIPVLNQFIEAELERLESYGEKSNERTVGFDALNELFLEMLDLCKVNLYWIKLTGLTPYAIIYGYAFFQVERLSTSLFVVNFILSCRQ